MDELIRKQDAIDAVLDRMDVEKHGRNAKPEEVVWALENLPPVQMEDAISRQAAIYVASGYCHPANVAKELAELPSVNSDLIQKIEVGIEATTPTDEYMVGMRNGMRWCKSLLDGKEPEYDIVQSNHNAEPGKMEIIHCKDCKFAHMTVNGECKYCDIWFPDEKTYMPGDYFCGSAERRGEAE